jgi:hypothetical protein
MMNGSGTIVRYIAVGLLSFVLGLAVKVSFDRLAVESRLSTIEAKTESLHETDKLILDQLNGIRLELVAIRASISGDRNETQKRR